MTLNLQLPAHEDILKPTITVVGVGGAGGNAVNNMIAAQLDGVDFVVANTDAQALAHARASKTVQLGGTLTKGLGAGANPDMGRAAAEEAADEIARYIEGSNMVFITAGMGGGTGTGAAPVVARIARDQGILTVAVVTKPFQFEGVHRMRLAETGLNELQQYVDTLIIIPNQNLFRIANERTTFADAFKLADEVLHSGVRGVTDLMVKPGLINLDFADIRAVMQEMGKAMMGTGESTGDRRAIEAAEAAISNPLLDDVSLKGAKALLINITGGPDMTLFEVDEAANRVRLEVDPDANIIFGSAFNDGMEGRMRVSVVATGIDTVQASNNKPAGTPQTEAKKPYIFAPSRPEPVKIQTRTAQDMPREFAQQAQPQRSQARSSAPAMTEQPKPAPRAAEPKAEAKPAIVAAVEEAPVLSVTGVEALFVSESGLAPEQFTPAMRESMPNKVNLTPQPRQEAAPAPRSEAPQVRDVMASISPREEARESYDDKELPSTRSLFQRIADVSRVLATRPEAAAAPRAREISVPAVDDAIEREQRIVTERAAERSLQVKENTRRDPRTAALFDEDQFIDIPAFLRRQAN